MVAVYVHDLYDPPSHPGLPFAKRGKSVWARFALEESPPFTDTVRVYDWEVRSLGWVASFSLDTAHQVLRLAAAARLHYMLSFVNAKYNKDFRDGGRVKGPVAYVCVRSVAP
jgi:hypothetical protein